MHTSRWWGRTQFVDFSNKLNLVCDRILSFVLVGNTLCLYIVDAGSCRRSFGAAKESCRFVQSAPIRSTSGRCTPGETMFADVQNEKKSSRVVCAYDSGFFLLTYENNWKIATEWYPKEGVKKSRRRYFHQYRTLSLVLFLSLALCSLFLLVLLFPRPGFQPPRHVKIATLPPRPLCVFCFFPSKSGARNVSYYLIEYDFCER